jgi:hypothetical protein
MDELHEKEPHRFTCLHFKLGMTCYKIERKMNQVPHAHVFAKEVETPLFLSFFLFQISMSITFHAITLHKSGNTFCHQVKSSPLYSMSPFPSLFPFCSL